MRLLLALCVALSLTSCSLVYRLPTRQGNVIEQKQLDKLALGMTREQVKFLLGTPLATSPFADNRWDYVGYYKSPRDEVYTRTVKLYFEDNQLTRMEGTNPPASTAGVIDLQDMNSVLNQEKKDQVEEKRAEEDDKLGNGVPRSPEEPEPSRLPNP